MTVHSPLFSSGRQSLILTREVFQGGRECPRKRRGERATPHRGLLATEEDRWQ